MGRAPYSFVSETSSKHSSKQSNQQPPMALLHFHCSLSLPPPISSSSSFRPKPTNKNRHHQPSLPARDRTIDFGKHKGRMLGSLPSKYLLWVSRTLRARNFQHWAELADEVLADPVYRDRIEWESAERLLSGNNANSLRAPPESSAVSSLLEVSERFGWDNEDKAGWARVDFELLGTSKGGRIPRVKDRLDLERRRETEDGDNGLLVRGTREERRRAKKMMEVKLREEEELEFGSGSGFGRRKKTTPMRSEKNVVNPFPGRGPLLDKIRRREMGLID